MAELATKAAEKATSHGAKKVEPWHLYVPSTTPFLDFLSLDRLLTPINMFT